MKQGKINWFDIVTTIWAIALVLAAVVWATAPAYAWGEVDCYGACVLLGKCEAHDGCYTYFQGGGDCWGECGDGTFWECGYGF